MVKVFVFDLDDTLYEEITFVRSGFRAVAAEISSSKGMDEEECFNRLVNALEIHGRGHVFDRVLESYGMRTSNKVKRCLSVYRGHRPEITLLEDARSCLQKLAGEPIYIVTDGNQNVQLSKLQALGLYDSPLIRKCFITRRYGVHNEKPSPYCFNRICQLEAVPPQEVVYVGDNPNKDFVGIKPLGFQTVRIRRGAYARLQKPQEYEADRTIERLIDLPLVL